MSVNEAREKLNEEFGDVVSVHKAFQMLGSRNLITPQVSPDQIIFHFEDFSKEEIL